LKRGGAEGAGISKFLQQKVRKKKIQQWWRWGSVGVNKSGGRGGGVPER